MQKTIILLLLALLLTACSEEPSNTSNITDTNSDYTEGVHYKKLKDPIINSSSNIEVIEFFWYGCSHCANFEPTVKSWKRSLPRDVSLVQSPAMWNDAMKLHAKAYFIGQSNENSDRIHDGLFNVIMSLNQTRDLAVHQATLAKEFSNYGVKEEDFHNKLNSFAVKGQVSQAITLMKQAELSGTPLLVVNGKYSVINKSVKNQQQIMDIVDFLIEKEREQLSLSNNP